jgi:CheY-like chemotaxis protein
MRHRASLVRDYGELPLVEANEASLGQVCLNLLINAAQAIPEGRVDDNEIRVTTYTDRDGRAVVEVRDTGGGIPPEIMGRIFDPFFTTKPIGLGTGLGLSICHRLVTSLGGEISVESEVGVGSIFRFAIPGAPRARLTRRAISAPLPVVRAARILVVDDEPGVGVAVQRMVAPPHHVTTVTSGEEALALVAAGQRYDVILCDVMMPNMTGMQLHEELVRVAPELAERMVFITGGAFTPSAKKFLEDIPNDVLEKPFDFKQLAATINEKLRQS